MLSHSNYSGIIDWSIFISLDMDMLLVLISNNWVLICDCPSLIYTSDFVNLKIHKI